MGHVKRFHREPLPEDVTAALLASPLLGGIPAGDLLRDLRKQLSDTVKTIRTSLASNPVAEIVATATAKRIGKRGAASIVIDDNGDVMLEIRYQDNGEKRMWHSNLPSLEELRQTAKGLGIEIEPLGRSKKRLAEAVKKATVG